MKQPLAYVHPEAQVADNVVIEPFVTIDKNVVIEEGTRIGSNVTILEGAHIGKNCKIFPGAVIAAVPQDLKFRGEKTIVKIGDNTTIRECVTVNRGTAAKGVTEIGDNCLIMAYAHIAHDCKIGNNCIITNACQLAGSGRRRFCDSGRNDRSPSVCAYRQTCDDPGRLFDWKRCTSLCKSRPFTAFICRSKFYRFAPSGVFKREN